ncbi:hypothetical protein [Flavobacterium poyangense]|nr:hypothetical protein [Flavobacterium sp. JXAS1]
MKVEKELLEKFQVEELERRYEFRSWTSGKKFEGLSSYPYL